jgi:hypothetical protein
MLLEGKSSFLIGKQINICDFIVADESVEEQHCVI